MAEKVIEIIKAYVYLLYLDTRDGIPINSNKRPVTKRKK